MKLSEEKRIAARKALKPEKSLLSTEDLNSGGRDLGKVDERADVGNQTGTKELTNEDGKIGGNSSHSTELEDNPSAGIKMRQFPSTDLFLR